MKKMLPALVAILFLASCSNNKSSTDEKKMDTDNGKEKMGSNVREKEERNKKIVLDLIDAFNKSDSAGFAKDLSEDVVDYGDGTTPAVKSRDSAKAFIGQFMNSFSKMKVDPILTVAEDNHVIVYSEWKGTFKNDFMGIKATGKSFKVNDADIFKLNDEGKITEHRSVQQMSTIMHQVGAKMPG